MLEDRDYMRQPGYEPRVSFTVALLIVNALAFIVQLLFAHTINGLQIEDNYFKLSLAGLKSGYVWELLTFQFMHASWLHLLGNSLAIFFFGRAIETALGGKQFLIIYFTSGIIGGLLQSLYALVLRQWDFSVIGASAGASGLLGAFAMLAWNEQFTAILYFFPVTMRGRTLFIFSVAMSVFLMVVPNSLLASLGMQGIANAAHLGGILAGFFYVRQIVQGRWHLPQWKLPSRIPAPRELAAKSAGTKSSWRLNSIPPAEELSPDEFLQKEVDPILDKISARGIQSLTPREREILEKARSRIKKR